MAVRRTQDLLRNRQVLLVHEDDFQRRYLARVIEDFGATLLGPVATAAAALALLGGDPILHALALSDGVERAEDAAAAARTRGATILLLGSPRSKSLHLGWNRRLEAPFSGYQVVEALGTLLHARTCPHDDEGTGRDRCR